MCSSHRVAIGAGVGYSRRTVSSRIEVALVVFVALGAGRAALAANGTWTNTTSGGLWSVQGNWANNTVASGTDAIADFSTFDISADDTVHLDSFRVIGQLKFGDATTQESNWILDNN